MDMRRFEIFDVDAQGVEIILATATWDEMAAANEPTTMEELAKIPLGESRTLGMCDHVRRVA